MIGAVDAVTYFHFDGIINAVQQHAFGLDVGAHIGIGVEDQAAVGEVDNLIFQAVGEDEHIIVIETVDGESAVDDDDVILTALRSAIGVGVERNDVGTAAALNGDIGTVDRDGIITVAAVDGRIV